MARLYDQALILFAKDPVLGKVKTRLQQSLPADLVLQLYRCFLEDSIEKVLAVDEVDRFIGIFPDTASGFFKDSGKIEAFEFFVQEGVNLGEKMRRAFEGRFADGYRRVVIIGSDSPSLPKEYIEKAFQSTADLILGPSTDGGYYLIGMTGQTADVFSQVAWSTDSVLADTLKTVESADISLDLLPVWYDVDEIEELRFLKTHLAMMHRSGDLQARATYEILGILQI